ncbi:MAG: FAD-binding oxidoreductase [Actinobacteria bacterium]|nr:FAD-binding oxidoreductase [Actinomycetota bacterium]
MTGPSTTHYDTVVIGGAALGSSVAYWLSENPDYDGSVLVIEPDPTYEHASTTLSEASVRHQFSNPVNIALSQFATEFIADFHERVQVDGESPDLGFRDTGYLFLATETGMPTLRQNHEVQRSCGVEVALLTPDNLLARFPYLNVDDLAGAGLGLRHEGNIDAYSLFRGFYRRARHNGVEYLADRVVDLRLSNGRVTTVGLDSGNVIGCNRIVNCAGPRARWVAEMARLPLPVEPRIRSVFVFDCREPLEGDPLPLTIDPSGLHVRTDPPQYMAGIPPADDCAVDPDDFRVRRADWEDRIWPLLIHRIPQFERIAVTHTWAGHYAYNTLDQNAVVGPADAVPNFYFANGFSGHGLQQSPGVGRAISELITYGEYRTLDLSDLGHDRIVHGEPFLERNII